MRCLNRNKLPFYYCVPTGVLDAVDENGRLTGEHPVQYATAVQMYANISPATGVSNTEQFGNLDNYDKVIVTDDMNCPIDENTVLFVDKAPEYGDDDAPKYDYVVKRVSKSLNHISIAVAKVAVS